MQMKEGTINTEQVERVLEKLGFKEYPGNDLAGLESLYGRWCRKVPFDNLQKRLYLSSGGTGPMPGQTAKDFFTDWLAYGTGGTCWAVSQALHDLLIALGFDVHRASGTMLSSPTVRGPNHGTIIVTVEGCHYLVDGSMLTEYPLPLEARVPRQALHPAAHIPCEKRAGRWHFFWRSLHHLDGLWCRIDSFNVSASAFDQYYQSTRAWSPFNYFLYARINTQNQVTGVVADRKITIGINGQAASDAMTGSERVRFLVEQLGISEEMIRRLPADEPLPPPPVKPS